MWEGWEVAVKTGFASIVFVTKWSETAGKGHMLAGGWGNRESLF